MQGYWQRQPWMGKVALMAVALVMLLGVIAVVQALLGSTGHGG